MGRYCDLLSSILNAELIYDFDDFPIKLVAVKIPRRRCKPIVVVCIYSPPPTKPAWIVALQAALSKVTSLYSSIIIVGDFNIDLLKVPQFSEKLCYSFALEQHVRSPTCVTSHSATLINHVYAYGIGISSTQVCELFISDHYTTICSIEASSQATNVYQINQTATFRTLKKLKIEALLKDLSVYPWNCVKELADVKSKVIHFISAFLEIWNKHALLITRRCRH